MYETSIKNVRHLLITPSKDIYNSSNNAKSNIVTTAEEIQVKYDASATKYLTKRSMDTFWAPKLMKMSEKHLIG